MRLLGFTANLSRRNPGRGDAAVCKLTGQSEASQKSVFPLQPVLPAAGGVCCPEQILKRSRDLGLSSIAKQNFNQG